MIGVELVTDRKSKAPAKKLCDALITRAYHNGLILLSCGAEHRAIHAAPDHRRGRRRRSDFAA